MKKIILLTSICFVSTAMDASLTYHKKSGDLLTAMKTSSNPKARAFANRFAARLALATTPAPGGLAIATKKNSGTLVQDVESISKKVGLPQAPLTMISDDYIMQSPAVAVDTVLPSDSFIGFDQRFLNDTPDYHQKAVIAHELGHLKHKHARSIQLASIGSSLLFASPWITAEYFLAKHFKKKWAHKDKKWRNRRILGLILALEAGALATSLPASILVQRALSRRHELEADMAAAKAGHGKGLRDFLASVEHNSHGGGWFDSHPAIRERIKRLDQYLKNKKGRAQ